MINTAFTKRGIWATIAVALFALLGPSAAPPPAPDSAEAASLPTGLREVVVFSGLNAPMAIRFAPGGQVFVAEKSGLIKVFDSLADTTPSVFADLNVPVYNFWDRGLLGLALHPQFPSQPYVYALYSHDAAIGGQAPRFGTPGTLSDPCPTPPGATTDGCVTSGRLSRLTAVPSGGGYVMSGSEQVLVEDWCEQFQTHSVGTVAFGPDGALYASGGEGAGATFTDHGQRGIPLNPCGDPPGGVGATLTPPSAEGGSMRSQDLRTPTDPTTLDGAVIRVDPATGAGLPSNPLAGSSDPNARRIIAYGLRNPFRFAFRPGTSELWLGDVGGIDWEEINRIPAPADAVVENFGWPCYEGAGRQVSFDAGDFTLCENLYAASGAVTAPYHLYNHTANVVPGETCPTGSSSISGMAFAPDTTPYPVAYQGALFFADYSRDCIWAMKRNGGSVPSPSSIETLVAGASNPVQLEIGLDGNLYYVDLDGGTVRRIEVDTTTAPPPGTHFLSDRTWTAMTNHCGPIELDRSFGDCPAGNGNTITLNGVTFTKGLGAHAPSDVSYLLGGACTRFKASVGLDDEVPGTNGSVTFQVFADATKVYDSGVMNASTATKSVDVSVAGASQLRLVITAGADANWDHADWASARIECGGASDTTPPTITAQAPTAGATGVGLSTNVTATFSEAMNTATITGTTFTLLKQGTSTPMAASVSYASQVATLDPTANLEPSTSYTATVKGGASGAKDLAGNALVADASWSFTTGTGGSGTPPPGTHFLSDRTWTAMTNHCGPIELDRSFGDCPAGNGNTITLNGVTFTKGLGAHAPSDVSYLLGGACTRFKASVGLDDEVPGTNGSVTFQVFADATKVYDSGVMNASTATKSVDVSVAGASQLRLVITAGADANWDHADWASARIECGGASDTTPPTITAQAPTAGATGVGLSTNVTATFSEAMNTATITGTTFTLLKQGTSTPMAASVSYASQVATLDPTANLEPSTSYTATVKGGASGAKDLAGNALVADASWSFTTGGSGNQPPIPVIDAPTASLTWKVGDLVPFNGHATDPEQGTLAASALSWTLLIQHCPSTCHSHTIQSWPGVASGSFSTPDHEYPSYLELKLTATDAGGASATTTLRLDPRTVVLTFASVPTAMQLVVNATTQAAPFTRTVIVGSLNTVSAVSPQSVGGTSYQYVSWSDGGAQTHDLTAPATPTTFTATYSATSDTTPPTVTGQSPISGATGVAINVSPSATFSEAMNAATITGTTFTLLKQGTSTPVAASVSYASQVATLDPASDLEPGATYTVTAKGGSAGVKDVAGNPLAADVSWSFTTTTGAPQPPPAGTNYLSDLAWTAAVNHCGPVENDRSFGGCAAGDGATLQLNGVTFAKGLGTHANSDLTYYLGGGCTRFKASVGLDDEVPGTNGSVTFQVYADATKIYDSGAMNASSTTQTIDVAVAGASQLRLVVDAGADANWDHADWALARVDCGVSSDTTPPTVTGQSPISGATGVAINVSPSATFSEAMNAATITGTTFTLLKQGTSTPVAASVSYASQVATLDPASDLEPGATYTVTAKGGSAGVKDVAGNPLAADVSWSFTTTTGAPQPPPAGTNYLSDLAWTAAVNHCGPVENDRSFGGCAAGDGATLQLNGVTFAKGLGTHANSDLTYYLGGGCTRFKASVGLDDEVPGTNGSVTFQVYADATKIYDSGAMNASSTTQTIDVAVAGASQLRLVVDAGADANWDHADWALARVDCG